MSTVRHHAGDRHASFWADFLGNFVVSFPISPLMRPKWTVRYFGPTRRPGGRNRWRPVSRSIASAVAQSSGTRSRGCCSKTRRQISIDCSRAALLPFSSPWPIERIGLALKVVCRLVRMLGRNQTRGLLELLCGVGVAQLRQRDVAPPGEQFRLIALTRDLGRFGNVLREWCNEAWLPKHCSRAISRLQPQARLAPRTPSRGSASPGRAPRLVVGDQVERRADQRGREDRGPVDRLGQPAHALVQLAGEDALLKVD